jgi:hypothetical protein
VPFIRWDVRLVKKVHPLSSAPKKLINTISWAVPDLEALRVWLSAVSGVVNSNSAKSLRRRGLSMFRIDAG